MMSFKIPVRPIVSLSRCRRQVDGSKIIPKASVLKLGIHFSDGLNSHRGAYNAPLRQGMDGLNIRDLVMIGDFLNFVMRQFAGALVDQGRSYKAVLLFQINAVFLLMVDLNLE